MKTHRKRKYRVKSKLRFIVSIVMMLGLIIGGCTMLMGFNTSTALTKPQYVQVEIAYGDTLWNIAGTYKSEHTDVRKAIYEICKINEIEADDLAPGMILSIPKEL